MKYLLTGVETERLVFRLLEPDDFSIWLEFFKQNDFAKFLGMDKFSSPEEQCKSWFEKVFNRYENNLGGMNVLIDKKLNQFVGQCGLLVQEVDGVQELEIGYSILPVFWNSGYATEAARKCKEAAFVKSYADSIISIIHIENYRSEKVALKNGMKLDKRTTFSDMPVNIFRITAGNYWASQ